MSEKKPIVTKKDSNLNDDGQGVSKIANASERTVSPKIDIKNSIPTQLQTTAEAFDALKDVRVASNDDLELQSDKSEKTEYSDTSDELSQNSETYDFMMVYMPMIRP